MKFMVWGVWQCSITMKTIVTILLLVPLASAHLCLLNPEQRGSISGLGTPGSDDCFLLTGPCGARKPEAAKAILWAGMKNNIIFQKNLDHFNSTAPGNFTISLWSVKGKKISTLLTMKDTNATSLYVYQAQVDIPNMEMDGAIQVIYYTHNLKAPAAFYQCADVMIKKSPPSLHRD